MHRVLSDVVPKFNDLETFGFDIRSVDFIGAHHNGLAVIDGFKEGIAKALDGGRIGHQVCRLVGIGQGVDFLPIRGLFPLVGEDLLGEADLNTQ